MYLAYNHVPLLARVVGRHCQGSEALLPEVAACLLQVAGGELGRDGPVLAQGLQGRGQNHSASLQEVYQLLFQLVTLEIGSNIT